MLRFIFSKRALHTISWALVLGFCCNASAQAPGYLNRKRVFYAEGSVGVLDATPKLGYERVVSGHASMGVFVSAMKYRAKWTSFGNTSLFHDEDLGQTWDVDWTYNNADKYMKFGWYAVGLSCKFYLHGLIAPVGKYMDISTGYESLPVRYNSLFHITGQTESQTTYSFDVHKGEGKYRLNSLYLSLSWGVSRITKKKGIYSYGLRFKAPYLDIIRTITLNANSVKEGELLNNNYEFLEEFIYQKVSERLQRQIIAAYFQIGFLR